MERPTWQITDGGLQSTVSEELRPTALEELNPGNTWESQGVEACDGTAACERP